MRFFEVVISGAALIAAAMAVEFNNVPTSIESGKTYTITYSPKDNTPTTIKLRQGDPGNLATLSTITTTATGGSFTWTVPASLPNAQNYALEIVQGGAPNYSGLIPLTGSSVQSSSASSSASSASSSSSSASSSKSSSTSASSSSSSASTMTTAVSASISGMPSSTGNSTLSATRTPTAASSGRPSSTGGSPPQNTGAASMLAASPVSLILGAIAAMAFFN